jgi:hypothetical protein
MSSEHGKLLSDSNGELQRGLDVVEFRNTTESGISASRPSRRPFIHANGRD